MITLVVAVLLLLSHFNLGGVVGSTINGIMFGLFGLVAYVFPFLLFLGTAFYLANRGSRTLTAKMLYVLGMLFMLTAVIQLLTTYLPEQLSVVVEGKKISLGQYYTLARDYKKGGGIFGGLICYFFFRKLALRRLAQRKSPITQYLPQIMGVERITNSAYKMSPQMETVLAHRKFATRRISVTSRENMLSQRSCISSLWSLSRNAR